MYWLKNSCKILRFLSSFCMIWMLFISSFGEMRIMVKIKIGTTTIMTTASFHSRRNIKIKLTTNVKLSKKMLGMSVLE